MSNAIRQTNSDNAARKALLVFAAGIAEATSPDFAVQVIEYLSNIAGSSGCDAETAELLADLISVIQPPAPPQRKFTVINGGIA